VYVPRTDQCVFIGLEFVPLLLGSFPGQQRDQRRQLPLAAVVGDVSQESEVHVAAVISHDGDCRLCLHQILQEVDHACVNLTNAVYEHGVRLTELEPQKLVVFPLSLKELFAELELAHAVLLVEVLVLSKALRPRQQVAVIVVPATVDVGLVEIVPFVHARLPQRFPAVVVRVSDHIPVFLLVLGVVVVGVGHCIRLDGPDVVLEFAYVLRGDVLLGVLL